MPRSIKIIDLATISFQSLERNGLIGKVLSAWKLAPENEGFGPVRPPQSIDCKYFICKVLRKNNLASGLPGTFGASASVVGTHALRVRLHASAASRLRRVALGCQRANAGLTAPSIVSWGVKRKEGTGTYHLGRMADWTVRTWRISCPQIVLVDPGQSRIQ